MEHYDVIIIGSGAGGGTLAHRLAPSGKRDPAARARRLAPPRAAELARRRRLRGRALLSPDTWLDGNGKPFQPQVHYYVGGATKLYGAALYRLRAEDFGELRHYDGISPAWPIPTRRWSPTTRRPSSSTRSTGRAARTPPNPRRGALSAPGRIARAAHRPAGRGSRRHRPPPLPRPLRGAARRVEHALQQVRPLPDCDGFPCLVHAKSDAEVIAVRPAIEHDNVTLLRTPGPCAWRSTTPAASVTEVLVERDGGRRPMAPTSSWSPPGAANSGPAAELGLRRVIPAGSPTAPTRSGATTCSTTASPCWRSPRSRTRPSSRRRWASTTTTSHGPDFEFPLGNIQMVGKSQAPMFRGEKPHETLLAPNWTLRDIATTRSTSGSRPRTCR